MKRNLMVFTAITSLLLPLAAPVVAQAQDRGGRSRAERGSDEGQARPDRLSHRRSRSDAAPAQPARTPRAERAATPDTPARASQPDRPARAERSDRPAQSGGQRPNRSDRQARPDSRANGPRDRSSERATPPQQRREDRYGDRQDRGVDQRYADDQQRRNPRTDGRQDRRNDNRYDRRDDRQEGRRDNRAERRHDRQDYREYRNRFDSNRWRSDWNLSHRSDWWRNDRRFRNYAGARIGFYFAPGYGYYNVPRSYWGQRWTVGDYLPSMFWRYQLDDWRTFGLGFPPAGTQWVVVDNQIYLIDQRDGYIIDVIQDAWNW